MVVYSCICIRLFHRSGGKSYLNEKTGIGLDCYSDHKRIGVMLISILTSWEGDGVTDPDGASLRETLLTDTHNKRSPCGAIMVFLFIIQGIPAAIGNFVLPLVGPKTVPSPGSIGKLLPVCPGRHLLRVLNLMVVWTPGGLLYSYSTTTSTSVTAVVRERSFSASVQSLGINFLVTIHKLVPRNDLVQDALFLWSIYGTALIQPLATPFWESLCCYWLWARDAWGFSIPAWW